MIDKLHKILGEKVKENIPLKDFTTFKIGGPARYFFVAESEEEIVKAVKAANKLGLEYFILGGGSNLLVADEGYEGLVIQVRNSKFEISPNPPLIKGGKGGFIPNSQHPSPHPSPLKRGRVREGVEIEAGAGVSLQVLVQEAAKAGLSGLEQATGIPGTLGGAIYGNAGGRYWAMGDAVKSVKLLYPDGKIESVSHKWLEFGYRESKLKKFSISERPIILSAVLELKSGNPDEIKKIITEKTAGREQKLPKEPSSGCAFKNLEDQSVGQLIDSLGLKGKCVGNACVSNLHGNFIVNKGNAAAKDVKDLIDFIKEAVKKEKGIELEEEIQYLGF